MECDESGHGNLECRVCFPPYVCLLLTPPVMVNAGVACPVKLASDSPHSAMDMQITLPCSNANAMHGIAKLRRWRCTNGTSRCLSKTGDSRSG